MKIDKTKLKKSLSEVPSDCKQLIEHLKSCNEDELLVSLRNIKSWNYGKCELYHWIDVLDYFDSIMERCVHKEKENQWTLPCDLKENEKDKDLLINIITFTSLLIEHSFSKHVYSSMEHLTTLLSSSDMQIVLAVLNLLYVFSKRSNFITRLSPEKKICLLSRLNHLADSWGGKENGFGLAECCQDLDRSAYPQSATTLHFEFYNDETTNQQNKEQLPSKIASKPTSSILLNTIHIDNVDQITNRTLAELMEELISTYNVPKEKQMLLFTHLRLAHYFSNYRKRLQCVQARLQALSIIVYSNAMTMQENFNVLYNGFIEELVEVLELKDNNLLEIKAAAIRTLTSGIHLDHTTKLNSIIDITGANSYHGFLPSLVRSCIQALIDNNTEQYTLSFATALFSFLYHLANYESGGEALVSCGMIDSLLKVISWRGTDSEHITFVTRAVRVIDLITNLEMAAFHTHADLNVFIDRLEYDVNMCRKDQPFEIKVKRRDSQDLILSELEAAENQTMEVDNENNTSAIASTANASVSAISKEEQILADQQEIQLEKQKATNKELQCYPQRTAVLKSILNFLKKAIQDAAFSDSIRHLMDGSLPKSLKHIISNAEYYGPSLFMLATDVVTVYVFQEPSLLSSLQENGLTDVILHALLTKDIPATKEVLASLPNVFSALCLNTRGLESFKSFKPFDKIFRVLLSPEYLPAMRRRRSNDPMGDTSINLGVSMDELMRHLPSLKQSAIAAIINLLKELCKLGSDPDTICTSKLPYKTNNQLQNAETNRQSTNSRPNNQADGNSSGDDDEEEEDTATPTNQPNQANGSQINVDASGPSSDQITASESQLSATDLVSNASNEDNLNQNSNSNNTNLILQSNQTQNLLNSNNSSSNNNNLNANNSTPLIVNNKQQQVVPLVDYILHVMKFLDAILSNNNTEDHCREFVQQKGLEPLLMIHQLPNLPIDFPLSQACFSLGSVCKSILSLSQEKEVLKQGLVCLQKVLDKLKPLHIPLDQPGGSVLLEELVKASELCQNNLNYNNIDPLQSANLTPLLHNLSAAHAYIAMFIILTRCQQNEVRNICITHWGSELGQSVLKELGQLYTSLVWESTILLAFCSENNNSNYSKFGQHQLERLASLTKEVSNETTNLLSSSEETSTSEIRRTSSGILAQPSTTLPLTSTVPQQASTISLNDNNTATIQQQTTATSSSQMDIDESTQFNVNQFNVDESIENTKTQVEFAKIILNTYRSRLKSNKLSPETKQIKTLLTSASRLGRALAELFNHLVKASVNIPLRRQRNHSNITPMVQVPYVTNVANSLTKLICNALSWVPPISPTPKFRLTFYICCVGFTSPLLFDERKFPYHLMLQSFVQCGGQDAFFETFRWALTQGGKVPIEEGLEHPNLPEGVGEFLDSWLMLLEKMVNPRMVLESQHTIPTDSSINSSNNANKFNPIKYLQQIHKKTFDCIMHLWNRKPLKIYGEHISETILVILCHLLRGETVILNSISAENSNNSKNTEIRNLGLGGITNPSSDSSLNRPQFSARSAGLVRSGAIRNRDRVENIEYNRVQIDQLVDMGFERESAIEAFLHTHSIEQAAEYLLERPNAGLDMSEDDQVLRAIAISLNDSASNPSDENALASASSATVDQQTTTPQTSSTNISTAETILINLIGSDNQEAQPQLDLSNEQQPKNENKILTGETAASQTSIDQQQQASENYEPLPKELMDSLTNSLLSGCLKLLDTLPQTVHRVCDILLAVSKRNGEAWTKKMLKQLIEEIFTCVNKLLECSKPLTSSDRKSLAEWALQISQIPEAAKAASRIHLFSLLFEEKKNECAQYVEESNLIDSLIMLLDSAQDILILLNDPSLNKSKFSNSSKMSTPKWLAPVILLIDLYDKAAIASKRRAPLLSMQKRQWKYFDDRNGKWTPYAPANNKTIDDAYCAGENHVRFLVNRRKYCVQFSIMLQVNEESVTYRPIMFVNDNSTASSSQSNKNICTESAAQQSQTATNESNINEPNITESMPMDIAEDSLSSTNQNQKSSTLINKYKVVKELNAQQNLSLIRACVSFLSIPVDIEALQAVMRLILRITRDYEMSKSFAELGGIKCLLKATQQSEFTEFISLATLIIRHIFEDPVTLKQTMEKVLRSLWASSLGNYREMHYQLRVFGPAACRDSKLLSEIAKNIFRIQFHSMITKKEDEDLRLLAPNAVQILRVLAPKGTNITPQPTNIVKEVISDLLNALTVKTILTEEDFSSSIYSVKTKVESMDTNEPIASNNLNENASEQMQTEQTQQQQSSTSSNIINENNSSTENNTTNKSSIKQTPILETSNLVFQRKDDLLFSQSVIMRILAELVKSYNVVAKLITDHQFHAGQSDYVNEDCSALAFILDNLLPNNQFVGDRDSPALARLLIVSLASSTHSLDAQVQLITEIKAALQRALNLTESNEKHSRIQALTGIINTMIDSYSSIQNNNSAANQSLAMRNLTSGLNSIIFRKGLFIDLARVSHSLDLSSPHMAVTMNTVLKPLETLSRAIHHPTNQMLLNQKKNKLPINGAGTTSNTINSVQQSSINDANNQNDQVQSTLETAESRTTLDQNDQSTGIQSDNNDSNQVSNVAQLVSNQQQQSNNNVDNSNNASNSSIAQQQISNDNSCSTPIIQSVISDRLNILNSLLMDVNDAFDSNVQSNEDERSMLNVIRSRDVNQVNDSVETVSIAEPMVEDTIPPLDEEYDPSSQTHQADNQINAIETETDGSSEIDEDEEDENDEEDEDHDEDAEDHSEDEEDEDEDHPDEEEDENDEDMEIGGVGYSQSNNQNQELEDFVLRYAVQDNLIWELEDENSPRMVTDAPYRYNDIVHLLEGEQHTNGADASQPSIPPGPNTVSAVHPLLSRSSSDNVYSVNAPQNQFSASILPRGYRSSRQSRIHRSQMPTQGQAGLGSAFPTTHPATLPQQNWYAPIANLHGAHSNPPVILQRLLGPSQNLLQLTNAAIQPARLIFTSNDYQFLNSNNWNDQQIGPESNDNSMLSSIATAITRWTEESKVLDGDSMHDCIANLKPDIIAAWEKYRDEEMLERKEKRKEMIEKDRKNELLRAQTTANQQKNAPITNPNPSQSANTEQQNSSNVESTTNVDSIIFQELTFPPTTTNEQEQQPNIVFTTARSMLEQQNVSQPQEHAILPENEQMEIAAQASTTEGNLTDQQADKSTSDPIEMTCQETISTEQEMEISSNVERQTSNRNQEENTPEPSNTIEISNQTQASSNEGITNTESASASSSNEQQQQSTSGTSSNAEEIPEGIDPSFLAALPENIRQEVIAEQLRAQRIRQQRTAAEASASSIASNANSATTNQQSITNSELNPEFLAALPPIIQEELIAQHNSEQRNAAVSSNPDAPVNPTDFIQGLPLALRRQVLTDIDDSVLEILPNHLVNEAQMLREEQRNRHMSIHMQERFLTSHAGHALSRILRNASYRGNQRYTVHTMPQGTFSFPFSRANAGISNNPNSVDSNILINVSGLPNVRGNSNGCLMNSKLARCKQLLDNEALSCLLILLFVDEPKLNTTRLHRVLRNLCNHIPTRQWVIQSLLSIMEKARETKFNNSNVNSSIHSSSNISKITKKISITSSNINSTTLNNQSTSWLSISMDAALGCRTDVFQVQRNGGSKSSSVQITINPQAAHIVCRHVLETLISLAKSFPYQFLPDTIKDQNEINNKLNSNANANNSSTSASNNSSSSSKDDLNKILNKDYDFWDVLAKLDSQNAGGRSNFVSNTGKSSKSQSKHSNIASSLSSNSNSPTAANPESNISNLSNQNKNGPMSTLAQIISLLAHPVIKRSSSLTDKLLRLLSHLAKTLPPATAEQQSIPSTSTATPYVNIAQSNESQAQQSTSVKPKQSSSSQLSTSSANKPKERKCSVDEEQLKLAVEVLTSKSCSEEGLEDATLVLLKLSQSDPQIRDIVLKLLLQGARQLGQTVCQHINNLSEELKRLNLSNGQQQPSTSSENDDDKFNKNKRVKGVIQDRFTKNSILITGALNTKHNPTIREVQLPSMTALTCKTSSQSFFLRVLKVIIQLRESVKTSAKHATLVSMISNRSSIIRTEQATVENPSTDIIKANTANEQMEIDNKEAEQTEENKDTLSNQLQLNELWESLSDCLLELANAPDHHAVLVLQPAVEAFFFVHACEKDQNKQRTNENNPLLDSRDNLLASDRDPDFPSTSSANKNINDPNESIIASDQATNTILSKDTEKFLKFAETHKIVLNQILRQSTTPLSDGPFSVLVDHTRVLDFDVKRRYFRTELDLLDEGGRREDLAVHVRREHVFEDSFRELYRRSAEEWKNRFYIVFENEEGQDAGGLLREWYTIISREIFNPMYALFCTSPGDRVTYMINSSSHCNSNHLQYFKFVGHVIGKAIYDNKLLDCYFTRSFYKHILGKSVKYTDMESEDYTFYQSLAHFLEHDVSELGLDLTFSIEVQEFGVTEVRDLKENGRNIPVTEENKSEYVRLVCQEKMTYSIKKQLSAFLDGFYEIIPKRLISIFNEQELELLISGLPTIDIDDLKANTEYHKYQANSLQIQWFWRALRSFDQADRAKFLQFVTGTSKVPLQGFATLEGMNGTQKFQIHKEDRSTDRLPSAHTCFNQLDLPVYETYDKLRQMLLKAIHECSEGFGFA